MRRRIVAAAGFLWLAPVLSVAAAGLGVAPAPALVGGAIAAALIAVSASGRLEARLGSHLSRPAVLPLALAVAAAVAILRIGAFAVFIADVHRPEFSVDPQDSFRLQHSCVSAYAESARFLAEGGHNIYERGLYRRGEIVRHIGPLRVDAFHYPPPFLVLPQAVRTIAPDFWDFRRIWFALQALTFAGALLGLAGWVGGRAGALALLGGLILLGLPHVVFAFQQGNFQITAVTLAVVAFVLLSSGRHVAGGSVLAYAAAAKIFPGVLLVPLAAGRQWRPAIWTASLGLALLTLTVALQGLQPLRDFVSTSLPEISSGAAFPQTESPQHSRVNWSAYGQTVRLRQLGVSWLTQPRGLMLTQLYGVAVLAFAVWAGLRRRFDLAQPNERLALILLALGLVGLASFRSPFVGGVYGCLSTFWVMTIFAARAGSQHAAARWLVALCALAAAIWAVPSPADPPSYAWLWLSGSLVAVCMAVSVTAVLVAVRGTPERAAATSPIAVSVQNA